MQRRGPSGNVIQRRVFNFDLTKARTMHDARCIVIYTCFKFQKSPQPVSLSVVPTSAGHRVIGRHKPQTDNIEHACRMQRVVHALRTVPRLQPWKKNEQKCTTMRNGPKTALARGTRRPRLEPRRLAPSEGPLVAPTSACGVWACNTPDEI